MFPILHLCQAAQVTRSFAVSHSIHSFHKMPLQIYWNSLYFPRSEQNSINVLQHSGETISLLLVIIL